MAETLNMSFDLGSRWMAEFIPVVDWLDALTGYSARGKVKTERSLSGGILLFDLSPYLTVVGDSVILDVPADVTAGLEWVIGAYDLELFDSNPAHDVRFLQGIITLDPEVTT